MKVSDVAGNQGIQCGAVTVSVEEEAEDEAPVVVVPIEPPAEATTVVEDAPPAPQQLGAPPTSPKETGFSFGSSPKEPTATFPMSETIAWGATASAAIGAFYAAIEERKRREAEARARAAAKRQKFLERMGWAKPKKMSYREIAKAYQNSINTFRARLKANGLSAYEVAKQSSNALRNGKIPDAKEIITEYKIKQAQRREAILAQKEETLKLKDPRPAYVPPDVSWKQQDYANLDHAREVAKQEKSWWENTVDWIDNHQAEISLGIGITVGVAAVILSGGAATPLVAAAWVAGSAAVAGTTAAIGTVALNNYYGRSVGENIWQNIGLAAGGALVTSGLGFLLAGGGIQAGVYKVGNSMTSVCIQHPTACARASSAFSLWDTAETVALRAKLAIQTAQGDPGAADTLLEIQLEQADGGMPGNTTIREITENIATLFGKHGDESLKLAEAFAHHGDEIAEISENGIIRLKDDVADFAETLNKIENDLQDINPNIHVYKSPENGTFYVSQPSREALEALDELQDAVKSGKSDAEIDLLIQQFAATTAHGDDELAWLGPWLSSDGGPNGVYINEALRRDGVFYDVGGDDVWGTLQGLGTRNGPDGPIISQEINLAYIQQQGDSGHEFIFKAPGKEVDAIEIYLLQEDTVAALETLKADKVPDRWLEAQKLMDMGFNYEVVTDNGVDYMWWYKP